MNVSIRLLLKTQILYYQHVFEASLWHLNNITGTLNNLFLKTMAIFFCIKNTSDTIIFK